MFKTHPDISFIYTMKTSRLLVLCKNQHDAKCCLMPTISGFLNGLQLTEHLIKMIFTQKFSCKMFANNVLLVLWLSEDGKKIGIKIDMSKNKGVNNIANIVI